MKKAILIPILLLILVGAGFFVYNKRSGSNQLTVPTSDRAEQGSDSKASSFTGNLMDVLQMGRAVKCTGSFDSEEGSMKMTVYAAGQRSYTESTLDMGSEGTMTFYSIYDGDWMYSWNDQGMATKMKVSDMEDLAEDMPEAEDFEAGDQESMQAFQQQFDYKCSPWVPDNSMFVPPSDVEFVDLTQTMQDLTESMESGSMEDMMDSGCAACDLIPDATQKAECKANLGCE